ncbi:MAG: hypothetical protein ACRELY_22895, partial [Polyangiaceae bacterium]
MGETPRSRTLQALAWIAIGLVITMRSLPAYAGCEADTECKGDRVCVDGTCREPGGAADSKPPKVRKKFVTP